MASGLPPPPTRSDSGSFAWITWYNQLYTMLSTTGSVMWNLVNKAGSSIADLQNKNHNLLTAMQGGTTNEYYHVTAAQAATIAANDIKYGSFFSTVTQTAAAANTAYVLTCNNSGTLNGVSLVSGQQFKVVEAGTYNIAFSIQLTNTATTIEETNFWLRKNGTDVPTTNSMVSVHNSHGGSNGHAIAAWNFFVPLVANDYVELVWSTSNTTVSLEYSAAGISPTRPATPSVIVTIDRVHA